MQARRKKVNLDRWLQKKLNQVEEKKKQKQ